jgi:ATP adenylyltransferase
MTVTARHQCFMCSELHQESRELWNEPLLSTEHFVVVPSLGAMLPGWLLIVPREHQLTISECSSQVYEELEELKSETTLLLESTYETGVVEFEHGPNRPNLRVGCSVDHAHLHAVPVAENLLDSAITMFPDIQWQRTNGTAMFGDVGGRSYLYFSDQSRNEYLSTSNQLPSQMFRQVIAELIGRPNEWNWRAFPCIDQATETAQIVSKRFKPSQRANNRVRV